MTRGVRCHGAWLMAAGLVGLMAPGGACAEKPRPTPDAEAAPQANLAQSMQAPEEQAPTKKEFFFYDAKGRRDPFMPLVRDGVLVQFTPGGDASKPVLYGILWDPGGQSLALINDLEAKVGDMVGEYQVTDIRKDAVVLMRAGEPLELMFDANAPPVTPPGGTAARKPKHAKGGEGQ